MDSGDPVHRNERVRANASGLGQFGSNSKTEQNWRLVSIVVIDKFVLGEGGKLRRLSIKATKGTFRFIAGKSSSKAYTIVTPAGTLGVRG